MSQHLLEVLEVSKTFTTGFLRARKKICALNRVNFNLERGSILGIIGESGSGKTTLARIILRLIKMDEGKILLENRDIQDITRLEYYRRVQMLFQDPYSSFNPVFRMEHAFKNAVKILRPISSKEQKREILNSLTKVRLSEDILDKYPHELSGGQLQRASIARILLINPELLIADEPTSMVDASLRITILNIFSRMVRELNKSIILITHDISQAFYICDEIIIMQRGRLVEKGPVEKVIFNPQEEYSKKLIADVPRLISS